MHAVHAESAVGLGSSTLWAGFKDGLWGWFWLAATVLSYLAVKPLYRRRPAWWTSPLLLVPAVLLSLALLLHARYEDYIRDTGWLLQMLGPATVAFAVPIWRQRRLIRRHALALAAGTLSATVLSLGSAWLLAHWAHLDRLLGLSLLPRSVTTPFAIAVSTRIGGAADLTALCVVITGLAGVALGDLLLLWLPLRSRVARGVLLGFGAHGAGTAHAQGLGQEEGVMSSLAMIFAGLLNVLIVAPLLARLTGGA